MNTAQTYHGLHFSPVIGCVHDSGYVEHQLLNMYNTWGGGGVKLHNQNCSFH